MHPDVGIPISETNFFPEMIERFGRNPRFNDSAEFERFYSVFRITPFFIYRQRQGLAMSKQLLLETADVESWESIAQAILTFYSPRRGNPRLVWGDKSPSYLRHLSMLKAVMPSSRFIHIIRDPRDQAMSTKRVWGKSLLRSAEVWRREVEAARTEGARIGSDYLEVRFEDLLGRPESTLNQICEFLGIAFNTAMLRPTVSHEDRGHAAGRLEIVKDNRGRFRKELRPKILKRLEEIAYPAAIDLGYEMEIASRSRPLGSTYLGFLGFTDAVRMILFYARDRDLGWSFRHALSALRKRGVSQGAEHIPSRAP
jgi:hypothetical protein